ncbi:MAG: U32 family peptidase [Proteobacteria bacterium]|nr:U32 family peptidase [Pseudomonadota bacterium]
MEAKLTLGPVLFNWAPEAWRDFYFGIADEAPVDSVCLGEVVCSKRRPLFEPYLAAVVERLERTGKEVVFSTLALIMDERETAHVRAIAATEGLYVEANDISAAALLAGRPHAIGPFINVYNEATLAYLVERGATRVCLPVELPAESLAVLAASSDVELEVQVFGRLPLAISARCYHARSCGLLKDNCQFVCDQDPDGMDVETLDGVPFLAINGPQILSSTYGNLWGELKALKEMGIRRFRLSPHNTDMVQVARLFRDGLDGRDPPQAEERLAELVNGAAFSNGFFHGVAGWAPVGKLAEAE